MAYTNSPLVSYTKLSPNHSGQRTHSIDRITPHCVVGQCSVETLGNIFLPTSRQASSNYGIGVDGRVGMYVEEKNRSWCSSSAANDQRAITIECASDNTEPYAFKDVVYQRLIELCTDICKRNGKTKLLWLGDKAKTLNYTPKSDEMVLSVHRWFANKSCPGNWMYARMGDLASKVTAALGSEVKPVDPAKPTGSIKVGDLVTITGSTYYGGKSIPGWVKKLRWYVSRSAATVPSSTRMNPAGTPSCRRSKPRHLPWLARNPPRTTAFTPWYMATPSGESQGSISATAAATQRLLSSTALNHLSSIRGRNLRSRRSK